MDAPPGTGPLTRRPPELAFRFRSGRSCLDLAATVGGRYREPVERLRDTGDLADWLSEARLLHGPVTVTDDHVRATRDLREAIYRSAHRIMDGSGLDHGDVTMVNRYAATAPPVPALDPGARTVTWTAPDPVLAALSAIARDAIELFGGPQVERMHECARPDCSLLFVDVSGAGKRRWCAMGGCGTLEKVRRHRRRNPAGEPRRDVSR